MGNGRSTRHFTSCERKRVERLERSESPGAEATIRDIKAQADDRAQEAALKNGHHKAARPSHSHGASARVAQMH